MREIPITESKKMLIDIMDAIDSYCRKESIQYSLAYGTLIGAVRHQGFIPWDDDIDILMPRKDYDKFIHSFHTDSFRVFSSESDHSYPLQYAKVSDIRTYSVDQWGNESYLAIDVFPIDGLPNSSIIRQIYIKRIEFLSRIWSSQLFTKNLKCSREFSFQKNCLILASKFIGLFFSMETVSKHFIHVKHRFPFEQSKSCTLLRPPIVIFNTEKMRNLVDATFEGHIYKIPEEYDYQLRLIYGDYMTVPPVEEQVNHSARTYWR